MLTATRIGAIEPGDVIELLPALITATNTVGQMASSVTGAVTHVTTAVDRLSALPEQFVREAKVGVKDVSYIAGQGFGRGLGWSLLPPLLVGTVSVLALLLTYRYTTTHIPELTPTMAGPYSQRR